MRARFTAGVVGAYVVLLILIAVLVVPRSAGGYVWVGYFLVAVTALFLVRYFSTRYTLDDTYFVAWRVLGSRRILLEDVRAIEYASLRDLTSTGGTFGMGSWGWRGRMHSVTIGEFDSIYTDAAQGLLVTAGGFPIYISPHDREAFARELSRRVRSYTGPLEHDVGNPGARVEA
jgi:Bacterial PH domain